MATHSTHERRLLATVALLGATAAAATFACQSEREQGPGDEVHPLDFETEDSPEFHGSFLSSNGYPLEECRSCHGDDYHGGYVAVSCVSSNCHQKGVEDCATCHDYPPKTGSHAAHHAQECTECHPARVDARVPTHPNGEVNIEFGEIASASGAHPKFDPADKACSVHCHLTHEMIWGDETKLGCDGCHEAPPTSHARFVDLPGNGIEDFSLCNACHLGVSRHLDGELQTKDLPCDGCHGSGPLGAPPPGLGGTQESPAIGAHVRHLDPTLADRIGRVARCDDCHVVPKEILSPGHVDGTPPADVTLRQNEVYDADQRTCTVDCHFSKTPGPKWDDASGAARTCDACHAFPPLVTRTGVAHPPAEPELQVCRTCHRFDPSTHVDGKVDFVW